MADKPKLNALIILDGWGINPEHDGNAVSRANTPCLDRLLSEYPGTQLICSGEAVGLPPGIMGNSEVGHMNIGAGRIVYQDLLRIDRAIEDRSFYENKSFNRVMETVREKDATLHLLGLVSDGGVHSQLTHLLALLDLARKMTVDVCVHAILDGRDTPPDSGVGYVQKVVRHIEKNNGSARIATICGRFYAMDRDKRWDRIQQAYRLYTRGVGTVVSGDPVQAVRDAYAKGETDEFVKPIVMEGAGADTPGVIRDGDGVIFFNFRADRAREITKALTDPGFDAFDRGKPSMLSGFVCMTLYDETFDLPLAYPPVHLSRILGEVISENGFRQLRIAETEKYAHVTYFFNGGEEKPFPGEDRCLIPSPREVATYDLKPEMSAPEVTEEVIRRIGTGEYHFMVLNFANMDMVGHTGVEAAAKAAVETVDRCLEKIVRAIVAHGGVVMVTADHGNSEKMKNDKGGPHTAHTTHPVPFVLVDDSRKDARLRIGVLGDIAPTILQIMGIPQPEQMTGRSLIDK